MKKPIAVISALLAFLLCATVTYCAADEQTYQQPVFSNQTITAYSSAVKNFNQSSHWLFYCNGSTGAGHIQLVGSADSVPSHGVPISPAGYFTANQCGVVQAGGYYFAVFAHVSQDSGPVLSLNAWYSGSTGSLSIPSNVGLPSTQQYPAFAQGSAAFAYPPGSIHPLVECDQVATVSIASNTTATLIAAGSGYSNGIYVCNFLASGVGGTSSVTDYFYVGYPDCGTQSGTQELSFVLPQTNYFTVALGSGLGFVFTNGTATGGGICYHHGNSSASVNLSYSWTTF